MTRRNELDLPVAHDAIINQLAIGFVLIVMVAVTVLTWAIR